MVVNNCGNVKKIVDLSQCPNGHQAMGVTWPDTKNNHIFLKYVNVWPILLIYDKLQLCNWILCLFWYFEHVLSSCEDTIFAVWSILSVQTSYYWIQAIYLFTKINRLKIRFIKSLFKVVRLILLKIFGKDLNKKSASTSEIWT